MAQTPAEPEPHVLDVVAIDGPSGAGKSTVARRLAERIGFAYLDTGALYRAVTWHLLQSRFEGSAEQLRPLLDRLTLQFTEEGRTLLNEEDVTVHLRSQEVEAQVSRVSALPDVRSRMRDLQRQIAARGPLVAEGRDMGSVVFPNARWKFYLDAASAERAGRRQREFVRRGRRVDRDQVRKDLEARDHVDSTREDAPLIRPADATYVDSTELTAEGVVERMMQVIGQAP